MIALTLDNIDGYVAKLQRKGVNVYWDGWTLVFFNPNKGALRSAKGRYRDGTWGFETRVEANHKGKWAFSRALTRVNV